MAIQAQQPTFPPGQDPQPMPQQPQPDVPAPPPEVPGQPEPHTPITPTA